MKEAIKGRGEKKDEGRHSRVSSLWVSHWDREEDFSMGQGCAVLTPAAIKATQKLFSGLLLEISSLKSSVKDLGCCLLRLWGIDQFFFRFLVPRTCDKEHRHVNAVFV